MNSKSKSLAINKIIINYKLKSQLINLNKYSNKGILINKIKSKKYVNPKISIISSVYNSEKFILRFLINIQHQTFDDIEIIFVDDFSKDNTVKIIEECQKKDKRIILIKQNKNKGTLISRNIGALKSKGEFLIFPDVDDMLSNKILKKCYNIAKRYNYELIRFVFLRNNQNYINEIFFQYKNSIYQPKLYNINVFYLNQYMIYFEDGFINYALHRNAKSLYLMKNIGYFYIFNNESITNNVNKNLEIKCFLLYLNFIFENSKNNEYEKNMSIHFLKSYINNQKDNKYFWNIIKNLTYILKTEFKFNRFKNIFSIIPYYKVY